MSISDVFRRHSAPADADACWACVPGTPVGDGGDMCPPCRRYVAALAHAQSLSGYDDIRDRPSRSDFGPSIPVRPSRLRKDTAAEPLDPRTA
jgi:hypothetical protein